MPGYNLKGCIILETKDLRISRRKKSTPPYNYNTKVQYWAVFKIREKCGDPNKQFRVGIAESDQFSDGEVFGGGVGASGVDVAAFLPLTLGIGGSGCGFSHVMPLLVVTFTLPPTVRPFTLLSMVLTLPVASITVILLPAIFVIVPIYSGGYIPGGSGCGLRA
jgi:hypothetical protein